MKRKRSDPDDDADQPLAVTRSEEELRVSAVPEEVGRVRARKVVEHETVERVVPRAIEHADIQYESAEPGDTGEVLRLADGSLSIPLFEEQLVVEKRLVVRQRVIIRKHQETEEHQVQADLRRERIEIDADPAIAERVRGMGRGNDQV